MTRVMTCIAPLFVPANRPDRFEKAGASGADAIILDLEDAVPADAKHAARAALTIAFTDKPVIIRINAAGTPWYEDDLEAVRALGPAAIMVPKAEDPGLLADVSRHALVIALIESATGLANVRALAGSGTASRLAFGSVDLAVDLGCSHQRDALAFARGEFLLASTLAHLPRPLDGVTTEISDAAIAADDARHAAHLGFGGKMIIHPAQASAVLGAFLPDDARIAWARQVLGSGNGAVAVDGAMVDEPVRKRARAILEQAGAPQAAPRVPAARAGPSSTPTACHTATRETVS